MRYDQKQFTQQGLNLFTNALSQKQSITIDKVIMDNLPTSNLSNLALLTLDDFANAQSFPANYTKVDNNMLTVDSVISNQGFTNSYSANEIGLVGHSEGSNDETLIAILVASDPFVLPAQQDDETPLHLIPNVTIQLANNDMEQVPVDTAQDAYIPQQDLDSLVAQHGYVKLSDADERYVKQQDFQNEVNNSVNKKADQSDVNQKFSQATAHSDQNYSNAVHDNHDGTVQTNGNSVSLSQYLQPCDLNNVTTTGFYHSQGSINSFQNAPNSVFQNNFSLLVTSNGDDVYQQMITAGLPPMYRMKGWETWYGWNSLGGNRQISIPISLNGSVGYNAATAYFNTSNRTVYMHGFADITDVDESLQLDLSNVAQFYGRQTVDGPLVNSFFNSMWTNGPAYPSYVSNNLVTFNFGVTQKISFENMYFGITI